MHLTPFHAAAEVQDLRTKETRPRSPAIGDQGQEGDRNRRTGIP